MEGILTGEEGVELIGPGLVVLGVEHLVPDEGALHVVARGQGPEAQPGVVPYKRRVLLPFGYIHIQRLIEDDQQGREEAAQACVEDDVEQQDLGWNRRTLDQVVLTRNLDLDRIE